MIKIVKMQWDKNKDHLQEEITKRLDKLADCEYVDIVKLVFDEVWNHNIPVDRCGRYDGYRVSTNRITEINNGGYKGALVFLVSFGYGYPEEHEYLMTHVHNGMCKWDDILTAIQSDMAEEITNEKTAVKEFMQLCKIILSNIIRPHNDKWNYDPMFDQEEN